MVQFTLTSWDRTLITLWVELHPQVNSHIRVHIHMYIYICISTRKKQGTYPLAYKTIFGRFSEWAPRVEGATPGFYIRNKMLRLWWPARDVRRPTWRLCIWSPIIRCAKVDFQRAIESWELFRCKLVVENGGNLWSMGTTGLANGNHKSWLHQIFLNWNENSAFRQVS